MSDKMPQNITDLDIQALVDSELDHEEAKKVRAFIASNKSAQKRYNELKNQKSLLKNWWQQKILNS